MQICATSWLYFCCNLVTYVMDMPPKALSCHPDLKCLKCKHAKRNKMSKHGSFKMEKCQGSSS